jgi:hypothetical protein
LFGDSSSSPQSQLPDLSVMVVTSLLLVLFVLLLGQPLSSSLVILSTSRFTPNLIPSEKKILWFIHIALCLMFDLV